MDKNYNNLKQHTSLFRCYIPAEAICRCPSGEGKYKE